jgi:hypothetical protein
MESEPEDRPAHSCLPPARQAQGRPPDRSVPPLNDDGAPHVTPAMDRRDRAAIDGHRRARSRYRRWHVGPSPADRNAQRRLGLLEVLLLALIALGVAITIAMAVIDPAA